MPLDEYELHERLERLSDASADRDVLVSLSVPADGSIGEARRPVETDYAEATQLDEQSEPRPLVDALETVRTELNEYEAVPENGLAIYAGAPDGDLLTVVLDDLPVAITDSVYEHDNEFALEPLEEVAEPEPAYGLLVVERGGAALGRLDDAGVEEIETLDSDVPGKSSAGGQSAERFERDRERKKREFFDRIAERAERAFLDADLDGVLLGGTTGTIERFREEADLDHRLEDLLEGEFAVEYATRQGLEQLAEKGREAIEERDDTAARERLEAFLERLGEDDDAVAYGPEEVDDALEYDAVETLLLSSARSGEEVQTAGDRAVDQGGEVVVVPDDFPEGQRFAEAFDGIGAILRFPIE